MVRNFHITGCVAVACLQIALARVDADLVAAKLLITECPEVRDTNKAVQDLWQKFVSLTVQAHTQVYSNPRKALQTELGLVQLFLTEYSVPLTHLCPGSLMRIFKRVSDAAVAAGDALRSRYLLQWGTTYRIMAVSRWYNRLQSLHDRKSLPIELQNYEPEYQGAYDMALEGLQDIYGVKPRPIQKAADTGDVQVLAVCFYNNESLPSLAADNHQKYCNHRGYSYTQLRKPSEEGRERLKNLPPEPHYWKVLSALEALERADGPEWVLVIDCDAFFTNASISVLDVAATYGPSSLFFVAEDLAGINTGVLLLRRHEWTKSFLQRVLQTPFTQVWDQSQFLWWLLQEYHVFSDSAVEIPSEIAIIHQSHFNAYHSGTAESWHAYAWQPGDYIIHYAGCPWDVEFCWNKIAASAQVINSQLAAD